MKLTEILELHPGADTGSAVLSLALTAALTKRDGLLAEAATADQERRTGLLTLDEKALAGIEKTAATARLAADRIDAILPQLRADLSAARGTETVAELRSLARTVEQSVAKMQEWQTQSYSQIAQLIGAGLHAEHEACAAYASRVCLIRCGIVFASYYTTRRQHDDSSEEDEIDRAWAYLSSSLHQEWMWWIRRLCSMHRQYS